MFRSSKQQNYIVSAERGIYLPIFPILIVVMLAFAALAVDIGWFATRKHFMQKAADAGALAGMQYRITRGWKEITDADPSGGIVSDVVVKSTMENLRSHGLTDIPANSIAATYDPTQDTVSVTISYAARYMFAHLIPGFAQQLTGTTLTTSANVNLNKAVVSLMLDTSASMGCPEGATEAVCNACSPLGTCSGTTKIQRLREAAIRFLGMFNPNRDKINIVVFSTRAQLSRLVNVNPAQGFNYSSLVTAINNITIGGGTNFCDALERAEADLSRVSTLGDRDLERAASYVFFTDGSPTAARFHYAPSATKPALPATTASPLQYDYLQYKISWQPVPGDPYTFVGASPLIRTLRANGSDTIVPYNKTDPDPSVLPSGSIPTCSQFANGSDETGSSTGTRALSNCLNNLGFVLPGSSPGPNVPGIGSNITSTSGDWRKQLYHCAISVSDSLRDSRFFDSAQVYAIGLGSPQVVASDPYQGVDNDLTRKDVLLARLALDPYAMTQNPATPHPVFNYLGYTPVGTFPSRVHGDYHATNNAEEIPEIFANIARKILLRLVD